MEGMDAQRIFTESYGAGSLGTELRFERNWFAVYTTSRHEKRVAEHLDQRGVEHYLPLYHPRRNWRDGSRGTLSLPLFPSYLFVRIRRNERVRVLDVPGALLIVGTAGRVSHPVPDETIEALQLAQQLGVMEPHPVVTVGQRARIVLGPLTGLEGMVSRQANGLRMVVTLEGMNRGCAVEVTSDCLEVIGRQTFAWGA
jgi:transcriptional antiterminator NusG